jgi:hypothetical protein
LNAVPRQTSDLGRDARVTRLLSAGVEASLEQFSSPEVLAAGKVNLIALDAVAERFGNRWPVRQGQVHDHVHDLLDRQLGAQGYHLRISDTDILICQPSLGRLAGQAFCLRLLRDILGHFLGAAEPLTNIRVHEVLSVSPTGVEARPADPGVTEAADGETPTDGAGEEESPASHQSGEDMPLSVLAPVAVWTPFVASNGRKVEITCTLDAVMELKRRGTIGLRFRRSVADALSGEEFSNAELSRLSRIDRLRIDLGSIAVGLASLRNGRRTAPPALILPVFFSSLSNLDDRARVVSAFQEARAYARRGLICELRDIDGVPATTLQNAATMIAPFSLFAVGHLEDVTRVEAQVLKEAGLRGLSTEWPTYLDRGAFLGWLKKTVTAGKHGARSVLVYRLPSIHQAMVAAAIGATHAHVVEG